VSCVVVVSCVVGSCVVVDHLVDVVVDHLVVVVDIVVDGDVFLVVVVFVVFLLQLVLVDLNSIANSLAQNERAAPKQWRSPAPLPTLARSLASAAPTRCDRRSVRFASKLTQTFACFVCTSLTQRTAFSSPTLSCFGNRMQLPIQSSLISMGLVLPLLVFALLFTRHARFEPTSRAFPV
jgi:hypothetical protein